MGYIEEPKDVLRHLHGAEAAHVGSVSVKEVFNGELVWDGSVEFFDIIGHMKATRVYAWAHNADSPEGKKRHQIAVLHIPPVISPETAVRAAIVQEFRNLGTAEEE